MPAKRKLQPANERPKSAGKAPRKAEINHKQTRDLPQESSEGSSEESDEKRLQDALADLQRERSEKIELLRTAMDVSHLRQGSKKRLQAMETTVSTLSHLLEQTRADLDSMQQNPDLLAGLASLNEQAREDLDGLRQELSALLQELYEV
jgi:chromosome segregation ATPase